MPYHMISEVPFRSFDGLGILGGFGERKAPACPPFKFSCTPDCPFPDSHCKTRRQELCDRMLGAVNLAKTAAARLVKPRSADTEKLFRDVFGQPPSDKWQVPGHPSRTILAGDLVARRFRAVANELLTRDTLYRCVDHKRCQEIKRGNRCTNANQRGVEVRQLAGLGVETGRRPDSNIRPYPLPERPSASPSCHPTDVIIDDTVAMALLCKNQVLLCPDFWKMKPKPHWQEGTLLHEMFHLCFGVTCSWFQHDQKERPRNSAYCYEIFALMLAGKKPSQRSIDKCADVRNKIGQP